MARYFLDTSALVKMSAINMSNRLLPTDHDIQSERGAMTSRNCKAHELLAMPREERNRILAAQAEQAAEEYRTNPELTAFEACGTDDFFDEAHALEERIAANVAALLEAE